MYKDYIITKDIKAREMYSQEAKENNYIINEFPNNVPGYELKIDEDFKTWCSVLEFNNITVLNNADNLDIPVCPNNANETLKSLYREYDEIKDKIDTVKNYIEQEDKYNNKFLFKDIIKIQYKFMLGYLSCIKSLIYHYNATYYDIIQF